MSKISATRPELSLSAVLRLALAYAVATNGMVLTPFLVAAVMHRFSINEGAATGAVGVEIIGLALSCALFPRWIARAAHLFAGIGIVGAALAQISSAYVQTLLSLTILRGLTGLF
jgi:MFS transporter, DHA1 family, inner membrane transport protein